MIEAPHAIVTGPCWGQTHCPRKKLSSDVENNKPEAVKILKEATQNTSIKIAVLNT